MMNGKLLLDTNIIVALFKNDDNVCHQLAKAFEVYISAISIGELYYGARHSMNVETNMQKIRQLANTSAILGCNQITAEYYGQIKNGLKRKGRPLPENDIWIAAIAKQYSLTIITRDQHFKQIDTLSIIEW